MKSAALSLRFSVGWGLIGLQAFVNELWIHSPERWDAVFVQVVLLEGVALVRRKKGDTLSEHVWAFQSGWARLLLVSGFTVWLCVRFAELGNGPPDVGRIALAVGLCGWLLPHFWWKGRNG